jgi:spermidine/putrescine transport system ATP-binding protein
MSAMDFVSLENISKHYGDAPVVDSVNLAILRGEFFSLLGPSGCGKTTLLRIIGGFTKADQGIIRIDGEDMTERPPEARPVNMVFQSYAIFPHLNVAHNIAYGLRRERLPAAERDMRVRDALNLISLPGYEKRRAHELSGGERQRVALARALVKRPKLLLLDEPLGALDKRLRESMQIELRQIQREVGITFLFVTHDQEEALAMSDRIAVMEKGRVLQIADPRTLYDAPNSRAVASFIGTMNFFDGRVIGKEGEALIVDVAGFGHISLPLRCDWIFSPGEPVAVAVRPERLVVSRHRLPGAASVEARVLSAVYLGDRSQLKLSIPSIRMPVTVAIAMDSAHRIGDSIHLSLSADGVLLFSA